MTSKLSYYWEMARAMRSLGAAPKVLNYLAYRCLTKTPTPSTRSYAPQIASLIVTTRCNLRCSYCCAGNIINQKEADWRRSEATLEAITRIFANPLFENCLLVDLLGGEPLLVDELEPIVSYLVKRGHLVNVASNGLLLADRVAGLKSAGISRINVSLYEANRKGLERDLPTINRIFPVHMSIVLLRTDVERRQEDLRSTARFLRDVGCRSLRFWMYRPMGVDPKPDELIHDTLPAYVELRRRMDEELPGFTLWPAALENGRAQKRCPQLWQRIGCDVLGNMTICCGSDRTLQGRDSNLFDSEPDRLWNHPTLVSMREQMLEPGREPPEVCKTCSLLGEPGW
jgi:MoaA/NifB/PqqE/SkfB family radical SAM enzyme